MCAAYPGRVSIEDSIVNVWIDLLRDVDAECVLQASRQLASQSGQWPPTVGDVRSLAVDLSMGRYSPVSPYEAWERALRVSHGDAIDTSTEERRALKMIGGIWQIKHSANISWDRKAFLEHYASLVDKNKRIDSALPETKIITEMNAPSLPKKTEYPSQEPELSRRATQDEIRDMIENLGNENIRSVLRNAGIDDGVSDE